MPAQDSDAKIRWEDGTLPVSSRFDDPYYSREDGLAESVHVFLDGNRLAERFANAPGFAIAELGFGTGLNCLLAARLWGRLAPVGALLRFSAFELYPMTADQIAHALSPWPDLAGLAQALIAAWPSPRIELPGVEIHVMHGDARTTVPDWPGQADAWFLDGFAPARNPEMWEPGLLQAVHDRTRPGGTFATYAAAGRVRRALAAGRVHRHPCPGFRTQARNVDRFAGLRFTPNRHQRGTRWVSARG